MMMQDKKHVRIGNSLLRSQDGESFDLEIIEVLDDNNSVVSWYFPQEEIQEFNEGKKYFPVGGLFCDWLNDVILKQKELNEFEKRIEEIIISLIGMDFSEQIEYILNKINSFSDTDKKELYNNFYECCKTSKYDTEVSVVPFGAAGRVGKKYILRRMNQRTLQEAFFMIDFAEFLNNKRLELKQCVYCKRVFFVTKKNQKYCSVCRNDGIPEKIKHKNNQSYELRNKIYRRLSARKTEKDYGDGIKDAESFAQIAKKKRKELSGDNPLYFSWLQEVERRTAVYHREEKNINN